MCHSELSNCVLINREGLIDKCDLTIHLRKDTLSKFALGELTFEKFIKENIKIVGDTQVLKKLCKMLDNFPAWFPIATHDLKFEEI